MENGRQFRINLYTRTIGQQVTLECSGPSAGLTVRVPVIERESTTTRLSDLLTPQNSIRALGVVALDLTPQIRQVLPAAAPGDGRRRRHRLGRSPLLAAGTVPGRGRDLPAQRTADRLGGRTESRRRGLKPNDATVLQIEREGRLMFIAFRAEAR